MKNSKSLLLITNLIQFLEQKGFTEVKWDNDIDAITFHNQNLNYNSKLTNQYTAEIIDLIDSNDFDSDEFIVRGSVIMFPNNYQDK